MLQPCERPLACTYDLVMLDLDGVVYVGRDAVAGAADHLEQARGHGSHLAFVTNNAARTPDTVAGHLRSLGISAGAKDVVTSAQAAVRLLDDVVEPGSRVLCLGGEGVEQALTERGFIAVHDVRDEPAAVVSGYGPDLRWLQIVHAAVRIRDGLPWIASNTDLTIPTDVGIGPGHGVLVRMLSDFTGTEPPVAGKPAPPLLQETIARVGGERPLMVGDRLDTDILGARQVGIDSLLVLTGVTALADLIAAPRDQRPTFLSFDLGGLNSTHSLVESDGQDWTAGDWSATVSDGRLTVQPRSETSTHQSDADVDDWWRCVAAAGWAYLDRGGQPADTAGVTPPSPGGQDHGR